MSQPGRVSQAASPPPALSTTASDSESDIPAMISDGKRMRAVWRHKHGDGEYTAHIVERTKSTIRGHPTWKILVDEIVQPIVRGSKQEPPRYVYLDDRACYIIWKSRQYIDTELKNYWPFDFDHQGNIKTGRPNRGRPAWVDSDIPVFATGKLRGKNELYDFSGEPETTEYRPLRPTTKSRMELQVEAEWAFRNGQDAGVVSSVEETFDTLTSEMSANNTTHLSSTTITTTNGPRAVRVHRDNLNLQNSRSQSVQDPLLDRPPHQVKDAFPTIVSRPNSLSKPNTPSPKRKSIGPFLASSSPPKSCSKSPDRKRAKVAGLSPAVTGASPTHRSAGLLVVTSSSPRNNAQFSDPKSVKASLRAEVPIAVAGASPDDKHGGRDEHRSSSLPTQLP